jgi:hypothetical protein
VRHAPAGSTAGTVAGGQGLEPCKGTMPRLEQAV